MNSDPNALVGEIKKLAEVLEMSGRIKRLERDGEPGAWRLAYAIEEIRHSVERLEKSLLPQLNSVSSAEDVEDKLHEIGEELRHLMYHVRDSGYFEWLFVKPSG